VQRVWIGCCDVIVCTIQALFASFQASYSSLGYVLIRHAFKHKCKQQDVFKIKYSLFFLSSRDTSLALLQAKATLVLIVVVTFV